MVNFIQVARTLCIVASVAGLAGCAAMKAYEGPELPKSEIAVIDGRTTHGFKVDIWYLFMPIPRFSRHETRVTDIDGWYVLPTLSIHVRPGPHSVRVSYTRHSPARVCLINFLGNDCFENDEDVYGPKVLPIDFAAEAGHEYRIPARRWGERNWIWVEDTTTGKMVAGEKPPDIDEPKKN